MGNYHARFGGGEKAETSETVALPIPIKQHFMYAQWAGTDNKQRIP